MPTYFFRNKNDKEKFSSRVDVNTLQEAIAYFAKVKQLPIEEFEKIYEVKTDTR